MPPAPDADLHVEEDIRRAETLPARAFIDPAILERELATVFRDAWLMVPERTAAEMGDDRRGVADLVKTRGARAPFTMLGKPLFLQRDAQGTLHCFPNVCTHAWHTLVQGPSRERTLACPQHGRQFDLRGRFVRQPGLDGALEGFPRDCDHLQALGAATWGPFVFASLGAPGPLKALMAPVDASLRRAPLARLRRKPMDGEVRELPGNWKQHAWNYLDSLHVPFIHRKPGGLADALDMDSYRTELHPQGVLQWARARDPRNGFPEDWLPSRFRSKAGKVYALWWFVWPNLALNFYPWGLSVNVFAPIPAQPQATRFQWLHYVWDERAYGRREQGWKMAATDDEDVDAMSQVLRGAASGLAPRGRFLPGKEEGPHWFHRRVSEALARRGHGPA